MFLADKIVSAAAVQLLFSGMRRNGSSASLLPGEEASSALLANKRSCSWPVPEAGMKPTNEAERTPFLPATFGWLVPWSSKEHAVGCRGHKEEKREKSTIAISPSF